MSSPRRYSVLPALTLLAACSSGNDAAPAAPDDFELVSDEFSLGPGDEKNACWATTLEEDLTVDRFDYASQKAVHHFLLAKTSAPEPDGLHDCGALFRFTWTPLFGAGSGASALEMPEGAAQVLPKGTQLLVQLHLLNTTDSPVKDRARIHMHRAKVKDPRPVGIYAFGTDRIALPASTKQDVVNDCEMSEKVELFAVLPHMHYLGTSLRFETGPTTDALSLTYERPRWSFDSQILDPLPLTLEPGTQTRVTCSFDNTTTADVTYGESSKDEMCFLVGFAVGRDTLGGCLSFGSDGDAGPPGDGGAACVPTENPAGIGAHCTRGGGECASGLSCTADQGAGDEGFCLRIGGCSTNADCGGGTATCCAPSQGGGSLTICLPEECRPSDCAPR